ncbi:hypothetical protein Y032_0006g3030 [Ancylostoma ceylanicum]|uniref:Uncharacterized protein n=1 Tax=Ancylostoma ceylanicum TaxID=53326 RepID=A0A016VRB5_9BILA|nr:hypothetical protein Y032_0006g3030 [Ancylostoma ceylanicum]
MSTAILPSTAAKAFLLSAAIRRGWQHLREHWRKIRVGEITPNISRIDDCCSYPLVTQSELQTVVEKGLDRGAGTLVVCRTETAGLLGRDTEENHAAVPALVSDRL